MSRVNGLGDAFTGTGPGVFQGLDGKMTCTAPEGWFMIIGFYDYRGNIIDSESLNPGESRVIAARGSMWGFTCRKSEQTT